MSTEPPGKKFNSAPASAGNLSALSTSELGELESLLRKFQATRKSDDLEAALSLLGSQGPKADEEPKEDWKINPVILDCIFNNLPVRDLKLVRLVCKFWAQIAAPALAKNTVLTHPSAKASTDRSKRGLGHYEIQEFLHHIKAGTVWDSRFQLRHVELHLVDVRSWSLVPSQRVERLLRILSLSQRDCLRFTMTSLRLETFLVNWAFGLMLPYWLPTYWKNLKELKLVRGFNVEPDLQFEKPSQEPPEIEVDLESLTVEVELNQDIGAWAFLKNCSKLKKVHLKETIPGYHSPGGSYKPPSRQSSLEPFQDTILQAFSSKQLETLKFTLPTVHKNGLPSNTWPGFVRSFVDLNIKSLKRFSLTLHVPERENLKNLAAVLKIPKCVQVATFNIRWGSYRYHPNWNELFASVFPVVYPQWSPNLKRLEFGCGNQSLEKGKFIVKSPADILWRFTDGLLIQSLSEISALPPSDTVLQSFFPDINYVCCAYQVSADAGLSCKTVLLERFGKEGVFNLKKLTDEWSASVYGKDRWMACSLPSSRRDHGTIVEPQIIRQVAVSLKGWTDSDLKGMKGNVFVFGHVPESEMAEAWVKVQKSVQFCSSTSVEQGFTPNFAQGSHPFHRTFTSRIGESYEEMCRRFETA